MRCDQNVIGLGLRPIKHALCLGFITFFLEVVLLCNNAPLLPYLPRLESSMEVFSPKRVQHPLQFALDFLDGLKTKTIQAEFQTCEHEGATGRKIYRVGWIVKVGDVVTFFEHFLSGCVFAMQH